MQYFGKFLPKYCYKKNQSNKDDILVKILLNEEEAKIPIEPYSFPFYKWSDVKSFLQKKL